MRAMSVIHVIDGTYNQGIHRFLATTQNDNHVVFFRTQNVGEISIRLVKMQNSWRKLFTHY